MPRLEQNKTGLFPNNNTKNIFFFLFHDLCPLNISIKYKTQRHINTLIHKKIILGHEDIKLRKKFQNKEMINVNKENSSSFRIFVKLNIKK